MSSHERRYQGFQRSRLAETKINTGADVVYEGPRDWQFLVGFLARHAFKSLKSDIVVGLETHFSEEDLMEMKDTLAEYNSDLGDRFLVGVKEQVIVIKPE